MTGKQTKPSNCSNNNDNPFILRESEREGYRECEKSRQIDLVTYPSIVFFYSSNKSDFYPCKSSQLVKEAGSQVDEQHQFVYYECMQPE